jgi:hypothetical protein
LHCFRYRLQAWAAPVFAPMRLDTGIFHAQELPSRFRLAG